MSLADLGIDELSALSIAVAVAGVFVGALLRGFTGFGLPLAAVPALTLVLAPALVVPAMLLLQILATLQALPRIYRAIHWPALAWLGCGALVGIPIGTALLARLPSDAMRLLTEYDWPGNVRELRNVIERATILARGEYIEADHLPRLGSARGTAAPATGGGVALVPGMTVDEAEQKLILATLEAAGNNKTRAAEMLGISLKTLHNKLNRMKGEGHVAQGS